MLDLFDPCDPFGGSAVFSPCDLYRYRLMREIAGYGPTLAVLMVNPSRADAHRNDPTVRRCIDFARRLESARLLVGNMFAFRTPYIKELRWARDPVGPENDRYLEDIIREADVVVAAWGPASKVPAPYRERWRDVAAMAAYLKKPLHCWGVAGDGQPRHPLMLRNDTPLTLWRVPD